MQAKPSATDVHIGLLAERATDALERANAAAELPRLSETMRRTLSDRRRLQREGLNKRD